ncbi:prolyl-trna synthetase [Plasmopara halstedii]|uniref:proline--tRNA ligase n=1 Tax=Plasmopara halstedii TaxID=4781 RepID=A0A0P1B263_PLAHL|nr:prolyl-trna synthetase [Plasmopara halstedii]CEG48112.1 prolyl-trna synthetase [Plasmopara halstedii]|eukprot:XP_024584481.1 prolyl-trna synthetase [Plasmopara halstedii]
MWTYRASRAAARRRLSTLRSTQKAAPCALRSVLWAPTEKNAPSDAAVSSHQLLLRAGFVRKCGHGLFTLLPLGCRVVAKLEAMIDDEMQKIGGNRVDLTILTPKELWKQSGRWQNRGQELMTLNDRRNDQLVLGPTHEESITSLVAAYYKNVGLSHASLRLYQIGRKFRDEIRPRFGLLRAREFVMKDMYSFDTSFDGALQTYQAVTTAYKNILISRLKLSAKCVEADSGNIGGNLSHEFHVLADVGEDAILSCSSTGCDYAANVEKAEGIMPVSSEELIGRSDEVSAELSDVIARLDNKVRAGEKDLWTVVMELQEIAGSRGFSVKLLQEQAQVHDSVTSRNERSKNNSIPRTALCFVRHDREVNGLAAKPFFGGDAVKVIEDKAAIAKLLLNHDPTSELYLLLDDSLKLITHASVAVKALYATAESLSMRQKHTHVIHGHFRLAKAGDRCPRCKGGETSVLEEKRGIEVGHVFYLGQKYSQAFGATYRDAKKNKYPFEMGCFGLGISRLVAAAVEASHDKFGIVWPTEIAPYKVIVLSIGGTKYDDPEYITAWDIAGKLASGKVPGFVKDDVLFDDRLRESPGSRLVESELIGYPYRVVVGKHFTKEGLVEIQIRATMEKIYRKPDKVLAFFAGLADM